MGGVGGFFCARAVGWIWRVGGERESERDRRRARLNRGRSARKRSIASAGNVDLFLSLFPLLFLLSKRTHHERRSRRRDNDVTHVTKEESASEFESAE